MNFHFRWLALLCILSAICGLSRRLSASETKASPPPDDNVLESFQFNPDWGFATVPVQLNGKTHRFLVDTGCTGTVLDATLQPESISAVGTTTVDNGHTAAREHELFPPPDCRIGSMKLPEDCPVLYFDLTKFRARLGIDIDGCVGLTFLHAFVVRIDCDEGRLDFLKSAQPTGESPGDRVPFVYEDDLSSMWVMTTVGNGSRVPFQIDTGWQDTGCLERYRFTELAAKHQANTLHPTRVAVFDGVADTEQVRLASFSLGSFAHEGLLFTTAKKNILGLGYLRRYRITIDGPGEMLYLAKGKHFSDPDRYSNWGLADIFRAGKLLVESVNKGSIAEHAGLRPNDVILEISGESVAGMTHYQVGRLLTADQPHGIDLVVDRDGERMLFNLQEEGK